MEVILTKEQQEQFKKASDELIKFLNDVGNPHVKVIVEADGAEFLSGSCQVKNYDHLKD